jgi:hypothetical protein
MLKTWIAHFNHAAAVHESWAGISAAVRPPAADTAQRNRIPGSHAVRRPAVLLVEASTMSVGWRNSPGACRMDLCGAQEDPDTDDIEADRS